LTSPVFFAIMPEFQQARAQAGANFSEMQNPVSSMTMIRYLNKLPLGLLMGCALVMTAAAVSVLESHGQSPQSNSSDKSQGTATPAPAAAANPSKPQTAQAKPQEWFG
jgi:hypothetical protein